MSVFLTLVHSLSLVARKKRLGIRKRLLSRKVPFSCGLSYKLTQKLVQFSLQTTPTLPEESATKLKINLMVNQKKLVSVYTDFSRVSKL